MRLIDADALKADWKMGDKCEKCDRDTRRCQYEVIFSRMDVCSMLDDAHTVDAVPVVRCKDCKHYRKLKMNGIEWMECTITDTERKPDWFCADGERKEWR